MKKIAIIIITCFIILSCSKKQEVSFSLKKVHTKKVEGKYTESNGMIVINQIDDKLIWFSRSGEVLLLDKNDYNILNKLKLEEGKGPGEYLLISEIFVIDNYVYMYDHRLNRFIVLKYENNKLKLFETINSNLNTSVGVAYQGKKFIFNSFIANNKDFSIKLLFADKDLKQKDELEISTFTMSKREDILNEMGYPLIKDDKIYYVSMGNGNVEVYDNKTKKLINNFYNKNKEMKLVYNHGDVNVITPRIIKDKYLFLPYNPHKDKGMDTPGMYYELFNLKGNLLDKGFIKFGLDEIPDNLMSRYTVNINSKCIYFYDKYEKVITKFDYIVKSK